MYMTVQVAVIFSLALSCAHTHVIWEAANELHPVHGLYIKPSNDGTTGDLYVAATEESGRKTEWLTDQPVSFLPAATSLQPKTVPLSATSRLTKSSPQDDKTATQKRPTITSPALKYAYGLPIPEAEGNVDTYPYANPVNPSEASILPCSIDKPAQMVQPYPLQYFYPPMMSASNEAMNVYKTGEGSEEKSSIAASTPYWPPMYPYPYQYVYIDPRSLWGQIEGNASHLETQSSSSSEMV